MGAGNTDPQSSTTAQLQAIATPQSQPGLSPAATQQRQAKKQTHAEKVREIKGKAKKAVNELGHQLPGFRRAVISQQSSLGEQRLPEGQAHLENLAAFLEKQKFELNERYNPNYFSNSEPLLYDDVEGPFSELKKQYESNLEELKKLTTDTDPKNTNTIWPVIKDAAVGQRNFKTLSEKSANARYEAWQTQAKNTKESFEKLCKYRELLAAIQCLYTLTERDKDRKQEDKEHLKSFNKINQASSLEDIEALLKKTQERLDAVMPTTTPVAITSARITYASKLDPDGNAPTLKDLKKISATDQSFGPVFQKFKQNTRGATFATRPAKAGDDLDSIKNYNHLQLSARGGRSYHFEAKETHLAASASRKALSAAKADWDGCSQKGRDQAFSIIMRTYLLTTNLMAEKVKDLGKSPGEAHSIRLTAAVSDPANPAFDEKNKKIGEAFELLMTAHLSACLSNAPNTPEHPPFLINGRQMVQTPGLLIAQAKQSITDLGVSEKEFEKLNELAGKCAQQHSNKTKDPALAAQQQSKKDTKKAAQKAVQAEIDKTTPSKLNPFKKR